MNSIFLFILLCIRLTNAHGGHTQKKEKQTAPVIIKAESYILQQIIVQNTVPVHQQNNASKQHKSNTENVNPRDPLQHCVIEIVANK